MKTSSILIMLIASCIVGCTGENDDNLRLYVLDGGTIEALDARVLGLDSGRMTLANAVFVVEHPAGVMVWDTGLPDSYRDSVDGVRGALAVERVTATISQQLREIDIDPDDVKFLALSHMHADHTGNANLFVNATLLLQEAEANLALSDSAENYFYEPTHYHAITKIQKIAVSPFDVFNDGRVLIYATPGHTIGHQSLLVKLKNEGNIMISGDLFHHALNRQRNQFPVFNFSQSQTAETVRAFEKLLGDQNAVLWIQHDPTTYNSIRKSPAYYE